MTIEVLMNKLADEIKTLTKDITFYDENGEKCNLNTFQQVLPRAVSDEEDSSPFPYCVIKFDSSKIIDVRERQPVDIVLDFGIYYEKQDCQYQHTFFRVFEKIKRRFLDKNFIGPFRCEPEMAFALSRDDEVTYPYYYAGIAMKWMVPGYEREDDYS